ncbi:MAG: hypothetical protein KAR44_03305 [Candidatus Aegiribacteria sp.]|nr:hypothetical protein [Candidatus Aegiribacteria sp.]
MWYIPFLIIVLAAGAFAGISRFRLQKQPVSETTGINSVVSLSMDQIHILLERLGKEESPESVFGAMCYASIAMPDYTEYICAVCGEKTVYTGNISNFSLWEFDAARRLVESIDAHTDFTIELDETLYCDYCSAEEEESPSLILRVCIESGTESTSSVSITDLRMLDSFLQGRLFWVTSNDGQEPLKDHVERMAELLGI